MAITSVKTGSSFTNLQKYNDFLGPNPAFFPNSYESIQTVTVGSGGASTVTFSSIPSTFTHLQIRGIWKNNYSSSDIAYVLLTINGTSTGYSYHNLRGDGTTVTGGSSGSGSNHPPALSLPSNDSPYASMFGTGVIDILDYKNTTKFKTIKTIFGFEGNGSGRAGFTGGYWGSLNAITSIQLTDQNGGNFVQYSSFELYGIKGV